MSARAKPAYAEGGLFSLLRDYADVKPHERVLDIGCGAGRWADALTGYLTEEGRYDGLDVLPDRIAQAERRVGRKYPNFHFHLINVFNTHYNPQANTQVSDFRFPFEDEEFDLVILYSVFTHMLPEDVERYFAEIRRLLKSGGRMLASYLLLNPKTLELLQHAVDGPDSSFISRNRSFQHDFGAYRATNPDIPEAALAYREDYVLPLYERSGLRLTHPIQYGDWRTQKDQPLHQDVIVAEKT
jgi:SAM-dependent methyltransferase